jgi:hypothetical protein
VTRKVVTGFAAVLAAAVVLIPGAAAADLDARTVTLQATDMPGARVTSQGTVKEMGYPSAYHRTFSYKTPNGGAGVLVVEAESLVATDAAQATRDQAKVRKSLGTRAVRNQLIAGLASTLKVKKTAVKVGAIKTPRVGDHAFEMPVTITLKPGSRVYMSLLFMQLDRVVSQFTTLAIRPIALRDTVYATAVAAHVGTALTPAVSVAPSITGTPQQGQTLTAAPGTWSAADATFAYQWQKCDAAGANCADIAGQTAQTYAVQPTDVGATLRVNVTATNRFGTSTPAPSAATGVVT